MTSLTRLELDGITERLGAAGVDTDGALRSTLIAGGRSNLTFLLEDAHQRWVLRMPPRTGRTASAHDVAREFRVTAALARTCVVPVPWPVLLEEDEDLLGGPFAISDFVTGECIAARSDLDRLDDHTLSNIVDTLLENLAVLHGLRHDRIGLAGFGRPDAYAERQVRRWSTQWESVGSGELESLAQEVAVALGRAIPAGQSSASVVHGDYRIDNTLLDVSGSPRVTAIVDWELSTIGDPVADVALMCTYRDPALDSILGQASAWTSPRLPDTAGLAARYEWLGGVPLDNWEFHLALAHFKLAVIAAGIDHRFRAGATSGEGFDTAGRAVEPLLAASRQMLGS